MEKMVIEGGYPLNGRVRVNGAKNAALPIMAACLLIHGTSKLRGIPELTDVKTLCDILNELGVETKKCQDGSLDITVKDESNITAPYDLVRRMRASICVLGPLLGKRGMAKVSIPGGCSIGSRPIDIHLKGIEALGAEVEVKDGYVIATGEKLKGSRVYLGGPYGSTVLGTCNIMMAAVLAEGRTIIENAACEPEVQDLANFLNKAGANISAIGENNLIIDGVDELNGVDYEIIPDRIEAGTIMIAGAITGGNIVLENDASCYLASVIDKLREAGVYIDLRDAVNNSSGYENKGECIVKSDGNIKPINLTTLPYPGMPTDMQAQFTTLLSIANGTSVITERVFPHRFMHIAELNRMGANIMNEDAIAIIKGVSSLSGTTVMASDLRASASLIVAGLAAKGVTEIRRLYHIDRGYERLEDRLANLGAKIWREKE
ncbi:UDP-N-acetylglucosamine 1-carboxyvinyltransferase [Candidatus Scalindua japonica]|uniref:UDP-N-acetylglucosamine 1-carboxyvinyltransferase n=1 Tax=Candidatus Scalindua japonica TaxID=1284222 RepID=A0A286TVL1_9BACT|nr:UDP-N-acetylglucosamine 1-carboxyvinyltransferase [Candidatus Scalindua japonica]GAX59885.1 UDP-N-acetylglucosamine 1-carboxyvinyltransferase [Candidatus Scalindua japonica]